MIDYFKKEDFSRTVYILEEYEKGKLCVKPRTLESLCREWAQETTTPAGLAPVFHLRGNELWCWGPMGAARKMVMEFDTKEQAEHALLLSFKYDLDNMDDTTGYYSSKEEAEEYLAELLEAEEEPL